MLCGAAVRAASTAPPSQLCAMRRVAALFVSPAFFCLAKFADLYPTTAHASSSGKLSMSMPVSKHHEPEPQAEGMVAAVADALK